MKTRNFLVTVVLIFSMLAPAGQATSEPPQSLDPILSLNPPEWSTQAAPEVGTPGSPRAPDSIKGRVPIVLRASHGVAPFRIAPRVSPAPYGAQSTTFVINYVPAGTQNALGDDCLSWPAGSQAAFTYAANLWGALLNSSVPIKIDACWASLGEGVLGHSATDSFYRNFTGAPQSNTWYAVALANAISGVDLNSSDAEMHIAYSSSSSFTWYFGTDGYPPMNQYDFVSVVLHEIAHGLNFAGSMRVSGGLGSWGFTGYSNVPVIYDRFTQNGSGQALIDTGLFPNPSTPLATQLTSNNVYFNGTYANAANGGNWPKLYAPSTWQQGSSYAHLDEMFNGTPNALMTYSLDDGEAVHYPGPITCGIFRDLGWQNPCPTTTLGEAVDNTALTWTTGGDANWFGETSVYHYGGDAAQSGDVSYDQSSWIQTTVTGPGIVSFYWRVSSSWVMGSLEFYIDGVENLPWASYWDWELRTYAIPSGSHTLKWVYAPSVLGYAGYLDKVVYTPGPAIVVHSPNGGETWYHRYAYTIKWASTEDVGPNVKVELYKGASPLYTISASTDNYGYYNWFVSPWLEPGTDYRIKITSTSYPTVYGYSDGYFTIEGGFQSSFGGLLVLDYISNLDPMYANADDHPELDVTGSLSIEAWVYYRGYSGFQGIVNKFNAYMLNLDSYGSTRCIGFFLQPASGSSGGAEHCQSPPPYYSGWHHVAGVFRADTGEVRTYLNGNLYSGPHSFTNTIKNSSDILQVGYNLVGALDEIRISDIARYTGSTYTVPTTPFTCDANTRALWHFDETQGATVFHDACGTDNVLVGYRGAHTEGVIWQKVYLPVILHNPQ